MLNCGARCAPGPSGSDLVRQPLLGDPLRPDCPDAQLSCGGARFGRGYNLLVLHPSEREHILPMLYCAVICVCFVAEPARPESISRRPSTDTLLARNPAAELRRGGPSNGFQMHPTKENLVCARGVYSLHTGCDCD